MSFRHRSAVFALAVMLVASVVSAVALAAPPQGAQTTEARRADHVSGAPGAPGAVGDPSIVDIIGWGLQGLLGPEPDGGGTTIEMGADGRLTILLIGSDYRPGYKYPIEHTDVIMVMSLDPNSRTIAAASIPRDVVAFPRAPSNGGGTSGSSRVNNMYHEYTNKAGYAFEVQAMERFVDDVSYALALEIDHYAYIRFTGVDAMIDQINGINVRIPNSINDPIFKDEPTYPYGIYFPSSASWPLKGANVKHCFSNSSSQPCNRAIVYVRSRKGSVGGGANSDERRARRQQELIVAVIKKVTGQSDEFLLALAAAADNGNAEWGIKTDLSFGAALELRDMLTGAKFANGARAVFVPTRFATTCCNLPAYSSRLKLGAVRGWIDTYMPAVP